MLPKDAGDYRVQLLYGVNGYETAGKKSALLKNESGVTTFDIKRNKLFFVLNIIFADSGSGNSRQKQLVVI